ncbi:MAG: hypothetical protein ABSF64_38245 [Bryobacteraceae bacterium]
MRKPPSQKVVLRIPVDDLDRARPQAARKGIGYQSAPSQMATDPSDANVKAPKGDEWRGVFRRRIGDYRILVTADRAT